MKLRTVTLSSGLVFEVPAGIQRIDSRDTHGWQVRYGSPADPSELFSDHTADGSGAAASLKKAIAVLRKRVKRLPAPTGLRRQPLAGKTTSLPAGISGPSLRNANRPGKTPYYCYQVSVPKPQGGSTTKSVYIGTVNTLHDVRWEEKLAKAIAIREEAVREAEKARTLAKRALAAEVLDT